MKDTRGRKWIGDSHIKVNNGDVIVRVLGVVENVFGSAIWMKKTKRERENQAYLRSQWMML